MRNKIVLLMILVLMSLSMELFSQTLCGNPVIVNDSLFANQAYRRGLDLLDAGCAWSITTGHSDIIVGVIDEEFNTIHEDLNDKFIGVDGSSFYRPNIYHGTSVSSCVAAATNNNKGIASIGYNTRVKGYRAGSGLYDVREFWPALEKAYQDGVKIINVSYAGMNAMNLQSLRRMLNNGLVLVVSAGNTVTSTSHSAYANIPGVINVSGVNPNDSAGPTNHARNQWVDVCALSESVAVCTLGNRYRLAAGTSYAAPQVAGVAALMRSVNPGLSSSDIENIIKQTTDPIKDAGQYPGLVGTGRVNAYKAVKAALCAPSSSSSTPKVYSKTLTAADKYEAVGSNILHVSNTTVKSNAKLALNACSKITITAPFTVEQGASLDVRVGP